MKQQSVSRPVCSGCIPRRAICSICRDVRRVTQAVSNARARWLRSKQRTRRLRLQRQALWEVFIPPQEARDADWREISEQVSEAGGSCSGERVRVSVGSLQPKPVQNLPCRIWSGWQRAGDADVCESRCALALCLLTHRCCNRTPRLTPAQGYRVCDHSRRSAVPAVPNAETAAVKAATSLCVDATPRCIRDTSR
jgi:hypothetical protein